MSDVPTVYYRARDFTYVSVLVLIMLSNLYFLTAYQFKKYLIFKNIYSIFSSHFFLHTYMILFTILTLIRTVLFHTVSPLTPIFPFLNSSLFALDAFMMTIFLIVIWTWNKEFFRSDILSCSNTAGLLLTKIFFVQFLTLCICVSIYFVQWTPEFERYLNLAYGVYYIFFFFTTLGFFVGQALRVRYNAIENHETTHRVGLTIRIIVLALCMVLLAIAKSTHLIMTLTDFKNPYNVVVVREVAQVTQILTTVFAFIILAQFYKNGSNVVYGKRVSDVDFWKSFSFEIEGGLKTASLENVFVWMLMDDKYVTTFLSMYPAFTTSEIVLQLFRDCYACPDFVDNVKMIRNKSVLVFQIWINDYFPFNDTDSSFVTQLHEFIETISLDKKHRQIAMTLSSRINTMKLPNLLYTLHEVISPASFLNLKDEVIAMQFCMYFQDQRKRSLRIHDLHSVPNRNTDYFVTWNKLTDVLTTWILIQESEEKRVKVFSRLILVAKQLIRYRNFDILYAFYSAFKSLPLDRIEWKFSKEIEMEKSNTENIVSSKHNFHAFKSYFGLLDQPKVPIFSVLIHEFKHEPKSLLKDSQLNWPRISFLSTILTPLRDMVDYSYPIETSIQQYIHQILHLKQMSGDILYHLSILREPKAFVTTKDKKIDSTDVLTQFYLETEYHREDWAYHHLS